MELLWVRHGEPERIAPGSGVRPIRCSPCSGGSRRSDWPTGSRSSPSTRTVSSRLQRAVEHRGADRGEAHGVEVGDRRRPDRVRLEVRSLHPDRRAARHQRRPVAHNGGRGWEEFGGDPPDEFHAPWPATVDTLVERFAGQRVVAVCHGGVVNVALGLVLGIERPLWFEPGFVAPSRQASVRASGRLRASTS